MLKQGQLTTEMSPTKRIKSCQTPNAVHALSTPASFSKGGISSGIPPLNWDESMIGDSLINKSDENKEPQKVSASVRKSRRKPVPIKSKYLQSAAKRKTPAVGKTPSTIGQTPAANNLSNRQKIEENPSTPHRVTHTLSSFVRRQLNREDTFTFEKKEPTPKPTSKTTRPVTPKTASRPTIKQSIGGSERKALRMVSKEISATPKFARKTVQSSNDYSSEENKSIGSRVETEVQPNASTDNKTKEVSETDLHILEHQKLQMLYILSKLDTTQEALSNEASRQMYQMWKVQENMRSEYHTLEVECLVKEYICEVNDICENLLPVCSELMESLPKFDKQFVTLCSMLDSTRHHMTTVNIARLNDQQVQELQSSLKQVLELLKSICCEVSDEKENILENAQELALLKTCFEESCQQYEKASRLARQIKVTTDENLFLTSTFSKLDLKADLGEDP
ncbi:uncharacterized protein LOC134816288 isoform X2 [Bolinopsis microptera]|uniref:uncharacterized protein LOC134816288 isoform X2 n=1 Tax=Bolinopsis microptera TaxID=2820187 RepID=UPI00307ADC76